MPTESDWDRLVNSRWPADMPAPTPEEAIRGAKRLYQFGTGSPWRGPVELTSGNRHTWVWRRKGVMTLVINPDRTRRGGWRDIVHDISHYAHMMINHGDRPHSAKQLYIERDMVDFVLDNGFHEGRLKPKPKAPPKQKDAVAERLKRVEELIGNWERKERYAQTRLATLRKERRRLVKKATG